MDIEEYAKKYAHLYSENISRILLELVENFEWKSFADLGCGDGSLLYALNKMNRFEKKIVYPVDLSETRIDAVKKINPDFKCIVSDVCDIVKLNDKSIDLVVSTQVIEHVEDDEKMIRELSRVVKDHGYIYLTTIFKKWYGWYYYRCRGKWVLDPTHLREYEDDNELFDIFKKYDFTVVINRKTILKHSLINKIIKLFKIKINLDNKVIEVLREYTKIPVPGYYIWEIVIKKKKI